MADRFALCSQCGVVAASCCCTASDDRILGRSARLAHRWSRGAVAASPIADRADEVPSDPRGRGAGFVPSAVSGAGSAAAGPAAAARVAHHGADADAAAQHGAGPGAAAHHGAGPGAAAHHGAGPGAAAHHAVDADAGHDGGGTARDDDDVITSGSGVGADQVAEAPDLAVGPLTAPSRVVPLRVLRAVPPAVPAPGHPGSDGDGAGETAGPATGTWHGPLTGAWDAPATGAWDGPSTGAWAAAGRSAAPLLAGYGALPDAGSTGAWAGPATGAALLLVDEPAVDDLVDGLVDGPVGAIGGAALLPPVEAAAVGGAALRSPAEPVSDPPSAPAEGVEALLQAPRRPLRFYVAPFGTPPFGNPPGGVDSTPFAAAEAAPVPVAAGRGAAARVVEVASVSVLTDTGVPASHEVVAAAPMRNRRSRPAWGPPKRAGA